MVGDFVLGDCVTWDLEAGHVSGTIMEVPTMDVDHKGHINHARENDPQ